MDVDESFGEQRASSELADDSIRLKPADPVATETRKHMGHQLFLPPVEPTEQPFAKLPRQFSTRFILLVTAVVAIASALIRQVEPSMLAGSCGVVALGVFRNPMLAICATPNRLGCLLVTAGVLLDDGDSRNRFVTLSGAEVRGKALAWAVKTLGLRFK